MSWIYKFGVAEVLSADATGAIVHRLHNVAGADPFPASPGAVTAVSSSAEDAPGQSGCSKVRIFGLRGSPGSTADFVSEVELDGTTPVSVGVPDGFRSFRAKAIEGATNVGNVDVMIGATKVARVPAGIGQTEMAVYSLSDQVTVARLKSIYSGMLKSSGSTPSAIVKLWARPFNGPWAVSVKPMVVQDATLKDYPFQGPGPTFHSGTDLKLEVFEFVGTSATIEAGFDLEIR